MIKKANWIFAWTAIGAAISLAVCMICMCLSLPFMVLQMEYETQACMVAMALSFGMIGVFGAVVLFVLLIAGSLDFVLGN